MKRLALPIIVILVACGSRSGFDETVPPRRAPAPTDASAVQPISDAQSFDATSPITDAGADAAPPPCHLVQSGAPFRSLETRGMFRANGMLLRRGANRVIQYGNLSGVDTWGWDDPPIVAAEYDVTTWPPEVVHAPTELYDGMHDPADMYELPGGALALAWSCDDDGSSRLSTRFRTMDPATWNLGPTRSLMPWGNDWSPLVVTPRDHLLFTYTVPEAVDGGGSRGTAYAALHGADGAPISAPTPLWSRVRTSTFVVEPKSSAARVGDDTLVVVAFAGCDQLTSAYCEDHALVLVRAIEPAAATSPLVLQRVASIPLRDRMRVATDPFLLSDGEGHTWLTWREVAAPGDSSTIQAEYIYGAPLDRAGQLAGPVESWLADSALYSLYYPTRYPSIGPLGIVYPISVAVTHDGSVTREVHLLHRALDGVAPIEDLSFPTAETVFPAAAVQIASPRALLVGYSTYITEADGGVDGVGEIRRFTCAEDAR